jgi:hypothetical protein
MKPTNCGVLTLWVVLQLLAPAVESAELKFGTLPAADANLDLAIPETPAFYALGLTPEVVSRPASPRELAADLLNGLDENGNFQTGIAFATVPYLLLAGDRLTIKEYRENEEFSWIRLAARSQLSVATTKGTDSEDQAVRAALGIRVVPYDLGDPRQHRDLDACFTDIPLPPPPKPGDTLEEREKKFTDEIRARLQREAQACREKDEKRYWNASAWELGAAPTWIQEEGTQGQTKWGGATFWTSFAYGFEGFPKLQETSQLILGFRYQLDNQAPDLQNSGNFVRQDTALLGARLRLGKANLHVSFEGSYLRIDPQDASTQNAYRISLAPEFKLPFLDNLWFQVSVGGTGGRGSDDRLFIMSSIRLGNGSAIDITQVAKLLGHPLPGL